MPGNAFLDAYGGGQQMAANENALAEMAQKKQRENETRNAYADAMKGGGDETALRENAMKLGAGGDMEGSQQLLTVVSQMDKVKRDKLSDLTNTYSPYFTDMSIDYKKALLDNEKLKGKSEYKTPQEVFRPFKDQYAEHFAAIGDPYVKSHLPAPEKFTPMAMGTFQNHADATRQAIEFNKEQSTQALQGLRTQMEEMKKQYDAIIAKGHDDTKKDTTDATNASREKVAKDKATAKGSTFEKWTGNTKNGFTKAVGTSAKKQYINSSLEEIDALVEAGTISEDEGFQRQKFARGLMGKKADDSGSPSVVQGASKTGTLVVQ